jgi:hypothetical protein
MHEKLKANGYRETKRRCGDCRNDADVLTDRGYLSYCKLAMDHPVVGTAEYKDGCYYLSIEPSVEVAVIDTSCGYCDKWMS